MPNSNRVTKGRRPSRGMALIWVLLTITLVVYLTLAFLTRGNFNLFSTTRDILSLQAYTVAEAAADQRSYEFAEQYRLTGDVQMALDKVKAMANTNIPIYSFHQDPTKPSGSPVFQDVMGYANITYLVNSPQWPDSANLFGGNPASYQTVSIQAVGCTRMLPTNNVPLTWQVTRTVTKSYNVALPVFFNDGFNFAYFMNHWAWWSGFQPGKAFLVGNTGANGNFDILDGAVNVKGGPSLLYSPDGNKYNNYNYAIYDQLYTNQNPQDTGQILGPGRNNYADKFGATDPSATVGKGIPMPKNLAQISSDTNNPFIQKAKLAQGTLSIQTVQLTANPRPNQPLQYNVLSTNTLINPGDGVYSQDNVVLAGTPTDTTLTSGSVIKIVNISGPVVVKGNVVLSGYVAGRGTLYTGRDLYLAGSVQYANPPSTEPNGSATQATVKTPNSSDYNADQMVFATGGSIVAGDVTNSWNWWTNSVGWWLTQYSQPGVTVDANGNRTTVNVFVNDNHEDNGVDGLVNSQQYLQSNDKENDGLWTVKIQDASGNVTMADLKVVNGKAQVPSGWSVIPGTGEDTDGDGQYTPAYDYNRDFNFASRKDSNGNWKQQSFSSSYFGNFPSGVTAYSNYARPVTHVDGFLMANNSISGQFGDGTHDVVLFGGEMARQDGQVMNLWGAGSSLQDHQDARFQTNNNIGAPSATRMALVKWSEQ